MLARLHCALFGLFLAAPLVAFAQASYLDAREALAKTVRQRLLSEFIVKEYLETAVGVQRAPGELATAILVFDDQIADLKAFAGPKPELKELVAAVEKEWQTVRQLVSTPPDRTRASSLRLAGQRLYKAAEANTAAFQRVAGTAPPPLAALSDRQRLLSQRVAKNLLLISLRIDVDEARAELGEARAEFSSGLKQLRAAPDSSIDISADLDAVDSAWEAIEAAAALERRDREVTMRAMDAADVILSRMERTGNLFRRLGTRK